MKKIKAEIEVGKNSKGLSELRIPAELVQAEATCSDCGQPATTYVVFTNQIPVRPMSAEPEAYENWVQAHDTQHCFLCEACLS